MKRMFLFFAALLLTAAPGAFAETAPSKDEKNLIKEAARLEKTAASPKGEKAVQKRITADFKVTADAVQGLRTSGLGYGDIVIVYSLARGLPGGVNDGNVQKVLALRQGPPVLGWDGVAKQAGTKLGKAVTQLKKVTNEAHREIKQDQATTSPAAKRPAAPPSPQAPAPKKFEGEGRIIERGPAAQ